MEFGWDEAKHQRNRLERGFGFDFAARVFGGKTIEWVDGRIDYGELRMRAIGEVRGRILHVVYTDRDDLRWIISARIASRQERKRWLDEP
jgi:uncharacterized DUF497 family protein